MLFSASFSGRMNLVFSFCRGSTNSSCISECMSVRIRSTKPVVVVVEELDSHGSPGCLGKELGGPVDKTAAAVVLVVVIVTLHVENIQIRIRCRG